jgi:hypothetical protein
MDHFKRPPTILRHGLGSIAALLLLAVNPGALAQSSADADLAKYRCAVLGDRASCVPPATRPSSRIEERTELGPYARYLKYQGVATDTAIAQARRLGESPTRVVVRITTRPLTDAEAYARYLGHGVRPNETIEILSRSPDIEPHIGDQADSRASNRPAGK